MRKRDEPRSDPVRSADPDQLERLFRSAQRDGFTPGETRDLWNRVGAALGAPADGGGTHASAGSAKAAAGATLGAKTVVVLALGGGIVAAGGLLAARFAGSAPHRAAADLSVPAASDHAASEPRAQGGPPVDTFGNEPAIAGGTAAPGRESSRAPAPIAQGLPAAAHVSPTIGATRARISAPPPHVAVTPASTRDDRSVADPVEPASASAEPTPSATPPPRRTGPSTTEGALLLRAHQDLASDPSSALRLTEEHARLFPSGLLAPEREVLAIEALARLGRLSEARARFATFQSRFPRSPHIARLEALLGR